MCFAIDSILYASIDVVECNMSCVCENVFMSVNPHNCDDMLHETMGVVADFQNVKLLKKKAKKFHENFSKIICENDDLIDKLNEFNKLVGKYKKLAKQSLEKLKEFECLNMDLNAKLVCLTNLLMILNLKMNLLRCMPSV